MTIGEGKLRYNKLKEQIIKKQEFYEKFVKKNRIGYDDLKLHEKQEIEERKALETV